ncbi:MAG TPA: carboxypeptidase M32 [Myxococcales bacterium]|jgi:carboxypeptidase Taq
MASQSPLADFDTRMHELKDLSGVVGILSWDQETFMPPKAGEPRAHQLSTMQGLYHEKLTDPALGASLDALESAGHLTDEQRAMVSNVKWERDRAVKVPARLVRELAEEQSRSVEAWRTARTRKDFGAFRPHLETLIRLRREQADALGHGGERYDALLDGFEPGMKAERLAPLFERLREKLVPLVQAIVDSGRRPKDPLAGRAFDPARQWDFTMRLLKDLGFDLEAGRQDRSTHPFTGGAGHPLDVRLTTRLEPTLPLSGVMSTIHECGHGLYEQGFDPAHARTYLAQAPSFGLHESQSRFWENLIGRSREFWAHYLPVMREYFPSELQGVGLEEFWAHLNLVEPSLVRVEADEVTYNLHILARFELELALMRGSLTAKDLPGAWNERYQKLLGVTPGDDSEGVMQDIHWAWGEFGYFPTYTIGNLYSAMLLRRLIEERPQTWDEVGRGELSGVLEWLRTKIHRVGFLHSAEDLVEKVSGLRLTEEPFMAYLEGKYRSLYGLR